VGAAVARTGCSAILPAVEQRSDTNIQPVVAAGTDPAYVPGLVSLRAPEAAEKEAPEKGAEDRPTAEPSEAAGPGDDGAVSTSASEGPPADDAETEDGDSEDGDPEDASADAAEPAGEDESRSDGASDGEGPALDVSDRRASIVANRSGIRFTLDEEEADFRWDEIGAVEVGTPRFGKRFSLTVHTAARRWYEADVEAPNRSTLKTWSAEFDAVLDAYFEEA
jgi:hypothetical protein